MPTNYSDKQKFPNIAAEVAKHGTAIGAFNQTTFNQYFSSVGGADIEDGYCAGVCIDWVRRVLRSPLNRNQSFLTYHHEELQAGNAQIGGRTFEQASARARETVRRMGNAYAERSRELWTQRDGGRSWELEEDAWQDEARVLNRYQKSGASKTFTSLHVVTGRSATYNSAASWRGALFGSTAGGGPIPPGCAARLGFNLPGYSGHAVALWRRRENVMQNDSYYFFDPNLGVFSCTEDGAIAIIDILFAHQNGDTPKYHDCGSRTQTVMEYAAFGPPNRADAVIVTATPPQVRRASIPSSTATQATPQSLPTVQQSTPPPVQHTPVVQQSPPPQPQVNTFSSPSRGLASPGNTREVTPTQTQQPQPTPIVATGKNGALIGKLQVAMNDPRKATKMVDGQPVVGGGVRLDVDLVKEIIAARITHPKFKSDKPTARVIAKTTVEQIIELLQ